MKEALYRQRHVVLIAAFAGVIITSSCCPDRDDTRERVAVERGARLLGAAGFRAACVSRVRDGYVITFTEVDRPDRAGLVEVDLHRDPWPIVAVPDGGAARIVRRVAVTMGEPSPVAPEPSVRDSASVAAIGRRVGILHCHTPLLGGALIEFLPSDVLASSDPLGGTGIVTDGASAAVYSRF